MNFIGGEMPEELKQAILQAVDQQNMILTSSHHDIQRLFSELSVEHLQMMVGIFRHLALENSGRSSGYLEGLASGALAYKHNICSGCGRDHDAEAEETLAPKTKVEDALERINITSDEDIDNAHKYNVSLVSGGGGKVRCNGCLIEYPSLSDRMLKAPDNCSGCHQKSAWG